MNTNSIMNAHMVGQRDVDLVTQLAARMPAGSRFIELGPWLGYLTRILARSGPVLAIDTFNWSPDHAKRVPGLHEPGESFRDSFVKNTSGLPYPVDLFEGDISDFEWRGPPFDFCLIDAPKTAEQLATALARMLPHLSADAVIVIINGRNLKHLKMIGLIARAVHAGLLRWDNDGDFGKSRAAVLRRGDVSGCEALLGQLVDDTNQRPTQPELVDLNQPAEIVSAFAGFGEKNQWSDAYGLLAQVETNVQIRALWEDAENHLDLSKFDAEKLGYFSHMVDACHHAAVNGHKTHVINKNPMHAIEEFWFRNADKEWRASAFHPEIIARAQATGYFQWPAEISGRLTGKHVLDVGCGCGLHGLGVLAAGAESYQGVDPELSLNSDRVKDLVRKTKIHFGYSGQELMELIQPFQLAAVQIEDFETQSRYDVALMHMVTQHVADLNAVIAAVARRLAPGGELILRHRNFNAWNGHQMAPNTIDAINPADPAHMELVDWRHLNFNPPIDHYIARKLNRVSLSGLRDALERVFDVETWLPKPSSPNQGLGRLTDKIRARHPELTDEDFETQTVFCVAKLR